MPNGATRSPDTTWIAPDRWNAFSVEQHSFAPIAVDFVIELRSKSDSLASLQRKMEEYITNGVRLGLLIDYANRQVSWYLNHEIEVLDAPEIASCEPELPDFELSLLNI